MEIISKKINKDLKLILFKVPIYDSRICFIKHDGNKGYDKALKYVESLGMDMHEYRDISWRHCYGFALSHQVKVGMVHFVFMNNKKDYRKDYINTLSHEITHLVDHIAKHHGLTRQKDGANEHFAYLTGYLTDFLFKV